MTNAQFEIGDDQIWSQKPQDPKSLKTQGALIVFNLDLNIARIKKKYHLFVGESC